MGTKICKKCGLIKGLFEFNKDKYSKDGLRYRCKECTSKEYKEFYFNNKKIEIERQVLYQKNNKTKVNKRRRSKHKEKYDSNLLYRLKINLRNRIKLFMLSSNFDLKINKTFQIVGCTPEELKNYIERQFSKGMSWENYGHKGWHIDHKIPLSSAKSKEEVLDLCKYTNLQPLWCEENYKKSNKLV